MPSDLQTFHHVAREMTRLRLQVRDRPDLYQIFTSAAVRNYDDYLSVLARLGDLYGIHVRPAKFQKTDNLAAMPPWAETWTGLLRSRDDPEASLALELLAWLSPSGLLQEHDDVLARATGAGIREIRSARAYLVRVCEVGYSSIIQYWLTKAGPSLTLVERHMLRLLESLAAQAVTDPDDVRYQFEQQGLSFHHLQDLGARLTRMFGYGPVSLPFDIPVRKGRSVDILFFQKDRDHLGFMINMPSIKILNRDTTIVTINVDADHRKDIIKVIERSLQARRETLSAIAQLILDYNQVYLLGRQPYRRNVPFARLKSNIHGSPKRIYHLQVEFEGRRYSAYQLLGYDKAPRSDYVVHSPLMDIRALRCRYADVPAIAFHRVLMDYGISISKSSLYRFLQDLEEDLDTKERED